MTKDEIKKALKTCSVDSCTDCPYDNKGLYCCGKLKRDALDLITEQEKEIKKQNGRVKCLKTRLANKMVLLSNVEDLYESETQKLKEEKQELKTALKQSEDNYSRAFERLKAQEREIERLKAENDSLYKKIAELEQDLIHADENVFYRECDVKFAEDKIKKQAQVDVLNKVKERAVGLSAIETYHICNLIDELIEEVNENDLFFDKDETEKKLEGIRNGNKN